MYVYIYIYMKNKYNNPNNNYYLEIIYFKCYKFWKQIIFKNNTEYFKIVLYTFLIVILILKY